MKKVVVTLTFIDGKIAVETFPYVVEKLMLFAVWGWIDSYKNRPKKIIMEIAQ